MSKHKTEEELLQDVEDSLRAWVTGARPAEEILDDLLAQTNGWFGLPATRPAANTVGEGSDVEDAGPTIPYVGQLNLFGETGPLAPVPAVVSGHHQSEDMDSKRYPNH